MARTFVTSVIESSSDLSFAGVSIGTASSDRVVIVSLVLDGSSPVFTGCTIAGGAATEIVKTTGTAAAIAIFARLVTSGTTATITATISGTVSRFGLGVTNFTGGDGTVTQTDQDGPAGGGSSSRSATLDIPTGGFALAVAYNDADGAGRTVGVETVMQ